MKSRNFRKKHNKRTKKYLGGVKILHNLGGFTYMLQPFIHAEYLSASFFSNPHDGLYEYIKNIYPAKNGLPLNDPEIMLFLTENGELEIENGFPLNNPEFINLFIMGNNETEYIENDKRFHSTAIENRVAGRNFLRIIKTTNNMRFAELLSRNSNIKVKDVLERFLNQGFYNENILLNMAESDWAELINQEMIDEFVPQEMINEDEKRYVFRIRFMRSLSRNSNDRALDLLLRNPHLIEWLSLSSNPNDRAVNLFAENLHKLSMAGLASNTNERATEILIAHFLNNPEYLNNPHQQEYINQAYTNLSSNSNNRALEFLETNQEVIRWARLSENTNNRAIALLRANPNNINWNILSNNTNDRAIELLEENPNNIKWHYLSNNKNDRAMKLLEAKLSDAKPHIDWYSLAVNENDNAINILLQNRDRVKPGIFLNTNINALPLLKTEIENIFKKPDYIRNRQYNMARIWSMLASNPIIFTKNTGIDIKELKKREEIESLLYRPFTRDNTENYDRVLKDPSSTYAYTDGPDINVYPIFRQGLSHGHDDEDRTVYQDIVVKDEGERDKANVFNERLRNRYNQPNFNANDDVFQFPKLKHSKFVHDAPLTGRTGAKEEINRNVTGAVRDDVVYYPRAIPGSRVDVGSGVYEASLTGRTGVKEEINRTATGTVGPGVYYTPLTGRTGAKEEINRTRKGGKKKRKTYKKNK